jgi:hypothetical protein
MTIVAFVVLYRRRVLFWDTESNGVHLCSRHFSEADDNLVAVYVEEVRNSKASVTISQGVTSGQRFYRLCHSLQRHSRLRGLPHPVGMRAAVTFQLSLLTSRTLVDVTIGSAGLMRLTGF